jgi:hypothetical protein
MKRGSEGEELTRQAEAEAELRNAESGNRVFRFWMPDKSEQQLTFLDGELSPSGLLDIDRWWEHNLRVNGSWKHWYPCTKDAAEDCPLCRFKKPALVYALTVIDHNEWVDKKGQRHVNERKLYICKGDTYKRLSKIASKRGGLTGCTFDVSRIGDKAENVGNDFDFVEKQSLKKVAKRYDLATSGPAENNKVALPYNYSEVIPMYSATELVDMGVAKYAEESSADAPFGASSSPHIPTKKKGKTLGDEDLVDNREKDKKKKDKKDKKKKDKKDKKKKDKKGSKKDKKGDGGAEDTGFDKDL